MLSAFGRTDHADTSPERETLHGYRKNATPLRVRQGAAPCALLHSAKQERRFWQGKALNGTRDFRECATLHPLE
jgi:hypothetical protein